MKLIGSGIKTLILLILVSFGFIADLSAQITVRPDSKGGLSDTQLEIWRSEKFQREFIESYKSETDIEPRVTKNETKQLQKVRDLIGENNYGKVVEYILEQRTEASSPVFNYFLGMVYFSQEKFEPAAKEFAAAVEKFPKFRRAWKYLGVAYVRQDKLAESIPAMTRVIALGGADSLTYGLLGYAYSSIDDYIAAESAYRMAVLMDPKAMDWKMGLVRSLFKQQRYASAAAMCQTLIEKNPDSADLWLLQANAYIGLKEPLRAAENYELVDRLGKATAASINMLGDIYVNEELYELAADCYGRAMERTESPKPARAIRAAKVMIARGAFEETAFLIGRIEDICSETLTKAQKKDMLKLRARIAVANGAGDKEAEILKQIVALDSLDGEALILLGKHSRRNDDNQQAIFYFERAAKIEKFEAEACLQHAQLLVSMGKYAEAVSLLKRAQQIKPREDVASYLQQVERISKDR